MKKIMITLAVATLSLGAFAGVSFGYQGTLCDAQGQAVASAEKTITFRLYKSPTAATAEALWGRSYSVKTGANGVFNVELTDDVGDKLTDGTNGTDLGKVIAQCAAASQSLYVGLTVSDGSGEIQPRQKMIATPYSAYAVDVGESSGDFKVGGALTVAGGINMAVGSSMTAGDVTAKTLVTSGDASMDSKLTVKGNLESQQDLSVGGALTVQNPSTFNTNVTVTGNLKVSGTITDQSGEVGVPIGTIIMWSGSRDNLPPGWVVCDGRDGKPYYDPYAKINRNVPDLRGRFIVGVGQCHDASGNASGTTYDLNGRGGEETHTLTVDEMPNHDHSTTFNENKVDFYDADHFVLGDATGCGDSKIKTNSNTKYTTKVGGSKAHENRPPYYALYYIIKVGEE